MDTLEIPPFFLLFIILLIHLAVLWYLPQTHPVRFHKIKKFHFSFPRKNFINLLHWSGADNIFGTKNFIFIERLKKRSYKDIYGNWYFWRTYNQQEIDLVEERNGKLLGFECKWSLNKKVGAPKEWKTAYPQASFSIITPNNYLEFIG